MTEAVLVAATLGAAAFVRSTFGFGDALLAMPILTMLIGVTTATPLVALVALPVVIVIVVTSWRRIEVTSMRRLAAGAALGIPIGALLLENAPERLLTGVLGVVLIVFGLYRLTSPRLPELAERRWAVPFGFVSGCLGGAYNTGGPPVVVYGALRRWSPARFRATLQGYFLFTTVLIVVSHGAAGLWNDRVLQHAAYSTPVALVATWVGGVVNRRFDPSAFERYLSLLLIALGVLLLA